MKHFQKTFVDHLNSILKMFSNGMEKWGGGQDGFLNVWNLESLSKCWIEGGLDDWSEDKTTDLSDYLISR